MVGIIKENDKLSRIVIPKEYRERYGFHHNIEWIATEHGILMKSPEYQLVKRKSENVSEAAENSCINGLNTPRLKIFFAHRQSVCPIGGTTPVRLLNDTTI